VGEGERQHGLSKVQEASSVKKRASSRLGVTLMLHFEKRASKRTAGMSMHVLRTVPNGTMAKFAMSNARGCLLPVTSPLVAGLLGDAPMASI
jgi:hypothetical protein